MAGLLDPIIREKPLGKAEVRALFNIPKIGAIAGSAVTEGVIKRTAHVRVLRDRKVVHTGRLASLKRLKDDVREVQTGFECGIGVEGFGDVKPGDIIEAYESEEIPAVWIRRRQHPGRFLGRARRCAARRTEAVRLRCSLLARPTSARAPPTQIPADLGRARRWRRSPYGSSTAALLAPRAPDLGSGFCVGQLRHVGDGM